MAEHIAANILVAAITNDEAEGKRLIASLSPKARARLGFHMLRVQHWIDEVEWDEEAPNRIVEGSEELPATDDCACGHWRTEHYGLTGACAHGDGDCDCGTFRSEVR